jgi:hypothetical protein
MSNIGDWSKLNGGGPSCCGGLGAAAWKKESCVEMSSASAPGVEEPFEGCGLAKVAGSGGLSKTIESAKYQHIASVGKERVVLRFDLAGAGLFANVVSSNGLHLKSFLYPPHVTLLLWHC